MDIITENGFGRLQLQAVQVLVYVSLQHFSDKGVGYIISEFGQKIASELVGIDVKNTTLIETTLNEIDDTEDLSALKGKN